MTKCVKVGGVNPSDINWPAHPGKNEFTWSEGIHGVQETPLQWKSWLEVWLKCRSPISSGVQGLGTELPAASCGSYSSQNFFKVIVTGVFSHND